LRPAPFGVLPDDELVSDPVVEAYKRHIDRTLLKENLKLTPEERLVKMQAFAKTLVEMRGAAKRRA
jgi:hypothetical protein